MRRLTPAALAASLAVTTLAVLAPVHPAAAAPADLSVTAGPPGTRVEVTVPDCGTVDDSTFLEVRLLSGTAPDEVLAGAGGASDGYAAAFIVPDWIDPDDPAVVEARCLEWEGGLVRTYDPVAFDVEAGTQPGTQSRSVSRTTLLTGQALWAEGAGCTFPGAEYGEAVVFPGADRTGRSFDLPVAWGFSSLDDGGFVADILLSDAGLAWGWYAEDDQPPVVDLAEETPNTIAPGPHTLVPYCSDEEGTALLLEPVVLDVTGRAPTDRLDLTVPADSSVATLAGEACTAGPVEAALIADTLTDDDPAFDDPGFDETTDEDGNVSRTVGAVGTATGPAPGPFGPSVDAPARTGGSHPQSRSLADEGIVVDTVVPDGSGTWSLTEDTGLDRGVVLGFATCGDPFADGFVYDPQIAVLDATTGTPAPVPGPVAETPPPAGAIPGRPTYTG